MEGGRLSLSHATWRGVGLGGYRLSLSQGGGVGRTGGRTPNRLTLMVHKSYSGARPGSGTGTRQRARDGGRRGGTPHCPPAPGRPRPNPCTPRESKFDFYTQQVIPKMAKVVPPPKKKPHGKRLKFRPTPHRLKWAPPSSSCQSSTSLLRSALAGLGLEPRATALRRTRRRRQERASPAG